MLVSINSSTSGDMIMFAEHLGCLFKIIGKECTARGVFTHEQLPDAIARLKQAILEEKRLMQEEELRARDEESDEKEAKQVVVHLGQRAVPLMRLMERTLKEEGFILWEAERDF